MSIINPSLFNASLGTSPQQVCFDTRAINSRGVFLGDDPLRFSVPLFLLDLSLMFFTASTTHCILGRLSQSRFVSDLLVSIRELTCVHDNIFTSGRSLARRPASFWDRR